MLWIVGKSHNSLYCWQFGEDSDSSLVAGRQAVAKYIYDRVIGMIESCCYESRTESPQYMASPGEEDIPPASLFRPAARVSLQLHDPLIL